MGIFKPTILNEILWEWKMGSRKSVRHMLGMLAMCASLVATSACTHAPQGPNVTTENLNVDQDPLEGMNRGVYRFNYAVDKGILKPAAQIYRGVVPEPGREMVTNFLGNWYSPVVFTNSVLQGDPQNSFATLWRFLLNTTFGVGGLFDFASAAGLKNRPADFGETLAMYGVCSGPYIVLPILGPSNARDALGRLTDAFINPFNYIDSGLSMSIAGATAIDARSNNMKLLDDIYSSSLDPYSTFRSGYIQKRASDIRRAETSRDEALKKGGLR